MRDSDAPKGLRAFQIEYGQYLRNPEQHDLPHGVPARRSEIYEGLLYNNISGFVNNCFPVAKSCIAEQQWQGLTRAFFELWRCSTPIFSQIPFEFVRFISETDVAQSVVGPALPEWLPELLHYEWVELEVDLDNSAETTSLDNKNLCTALTTASHIRVNPTLKLLSYNWAVHQIAADNLPSDAQQTCLVVYRDAALSVRFLEVNTTTLMLLQVIQSDAGYVGKILEGFAQHIDHPDPPALVAFGIQLLADLMAQEIIYGENE